MKMCLIAVGRMKTGPETLLMERYATRIPSMAKTLGITALPVFEIPESREKQPEHRKREEARALLSKIPASTLIVFDERGETVSSVQFADHLARLRDKGCASLACVIGGPDGLDPSLRDKANVCLSFGAMTLPHQMVRVLVMEQLYRAMTLLSGHPYHRE
jgi:23S rRNA (pseudouridine1915-N3)-methyltransferase